MKIGNIIFLAMVLNLSTSNFITFAKDTQNKQVPPIFKNKLGMSFVYVNPGTFMMGSKPFTAESADEDARFMERPLHKVTLTNGFYMQATEVTQEQWKAVMGTNTPYFSAGTNLPVRVDHWNELSPFIKKLNQRGDGVYRLPTEAEWEYAARAESTTEYACGDDFHCLVNMAWFQSWGLTNTNTSTVFESIHPVAQKQPNTWGLYDMHGNVWEWVSDWYDRYPNGPVTNPIGPTPGKNSEHIFRGGSYSSSPDRLRSAYRQFGSITDEDAPGFRVVRLP